MSATTDELPELPDGAFDKQDTGDDATFYAPPRLVSHIDERATAALTAFYNAVLPAHGLGGGGCCLWTPRHLLQRHEVDQQQAVSSEPPAAK